MDRLFDDFSGGLWRGSLFDIAPLPSMLKQLSALCLQLNLQETDKAYEITAELPIEVKLANGVLSIKGEK